MRLLFSHQTVSVGRYLRQVAMVFSLSNATFHGQKRNQNAMSFEFTQEFYGTIFV